MTTELARKAEEIGRLVTNVNSLQFELSDLGVLFEERDASYNLLEKELINMKENTNTILAEKQLRIAELETSIQELVLLESSLDEEYCNIGLQPTIAVSNEKDLTCNIIDNNLMKDKTQNELVNALNEINLLQKEKELLEAKIDYLTALEKSNEKDKLKYDKDILKLQKELQKASEEISLLKEKLLFNESTKIESKEIIRLKAECEATNAEIMLLKRELKRTVDEVNTLRSEQKKL
jgi:hypothetical protein